MRIRMLPAAAVLLCAAVACVETPTPGGPASGAPVTVPMPGDDNGDGRIEEDESGWDCSVHGNRVCGTAVAAECRGAGEALAQCVTVAARPAYSWTNADGSRTRVPGGRAQLRDLDAQPGTAGFAAALDALDAEYRAHNGR